LRSPGSYLDQRGLTLFVDKAGRRYWRFSFWWLGRARMMSLGPADRVSLIEARNMQAEARILLAKGIDPIDQRRREMPPLPRAIELRTTTTMSWEAIAASFGVRRQTLQIRVWKHLAASGQLTEAVVRTIWRPKNGRMSWPHLEQTTGLHLRPWRAGLTQQRAPGGCPNADRDDPARRQDAG
jgi:hypothetical protein